MKKCRGFGEKEGKCQNEANENGFFCPECEEKRVEHIDKRLHEIMDEMERKSLKNANKGSKI